MLGEAGALGSTPTARQRREIDAVTTARAAVARRVRSGNIVCGYHGWRLRTAAALRARAAGEGSGASGPISRSPLSLRERYGSLGGALDAPLQDITDSRGADRHSAASHPVYEVGAAGPAPDGRTRSTPHISRSSTQRTSATSPSPSRFDGRSTRPTGASARRKRIRGVTRATAKAVRAWTRIAAPATQQRLGHAVSPPDRISIRTACTTC